MSTRQRLDSYHTKKTIEVGGHAYQIASLRALEGALKVDLARLPTSLKILLENLLRREDGRQVSQKDIEALVHWDPKAVPDKEIAFMPARVLLQDFTGVPAVVDLAAMRDAIATMGGDPAVINPLSPADLVVDHSVQVDNFGTAQAFNENARLELERNRERYAFLRWGQKAFKRFRVVPPDTGIVHQINLEYLAQVVFTETPEAGGSHVSLAYPDTLVGTDSHTTMINGLGVLGWGVGGIEAEAALLGQPISMLIPEVVGFSLEGELPAGTTATDLVLTVTQILRKAKVVGKFVEFFGPGLKSLSLADRATIANMAPEYGATMGFFPVDEETLKYVRFTGRGEALAHLTEAYCKEQGLFFTPGQKEPEFSSRLSLDLSAVEPSLAGPKRPQDRVALKGTKTSFRKALADMLPGDVQKLDQEAFVRWRDEGTASQQNGSGGTHAAAQHELGGLARRANVDDNGQHFAVSHGSVVIAAITSCTNTSNPSVMVAAGLLAKKAAQRGLKSRPWVKTSLAPGSKVVTRYLEQLGLMTYLDQIGFNLVGYGCTTCIGNSGPLSDSISKAVKQEDLVVAAVLSGNRNFEGRINPQVKANYLASPPLVVAYALAGTMDKDLTHEPLATDSAGKPVYLSEIWPTASEVAAAVAEGVKPEQFTEEYSDVFRGDDNWRSLSVPEGDRFAWDAASTYIKKPTFFDDMPKEPGALKDIVGARCLAVLGDSVTTDHISPAGNIGKDSPAGTYLIAAGISPRDFNSYGARRGNHEVMVRGTFANIRLRNLLAAGTEGGVTLHLPDKAPMSIYDASIKYKEEGTPLVVLAGKEYGTGSSRDWAAKGTNLLGIRAVLAESFERIHRSNLVGMGVLPLEYLPGEDRTTHGLTGFERYDIAGLSKGLKAGQTIAVRVTSDDGKSRELQARVRIDTPDEVEYYRHGGILLYVLRQLLLG